MVGVILQMGALILCGVIWRLLKPGGLHAGETRRVLTSVVYYLLLPALVLSVLWQAPLGLNSLRISLVAGVTVLAAMLVTWGGCRSCHSQSPSTGAMLLAASFPNATYLGLPVLEKVLGNPGRSIAIQYDLFACLPLLLTVGLYAAQHFGGGARRAHPLHELLKVPPLWAAVVAVALNLAHVEMGDWLQHWLGLLASGVVPLMLFSLGLSLELGTWHPRQLPALGAVVVIQLLLAPLFAWWLARVVGLSGTNLTGVVLEAGMPSMVLGIVISDRFGLDTPLYAAAVTVTTALSLVSLPFWFGVLGGGV